MATQEIPEEWRPVEGWPYEVSSLGRVRRSAPGRRTFVGRICSAMRCKKTGYFAVQLSRDDKFWRPNVHRLVCIAFRGKPPSAGHQVAHNDGNKSNNARDNLRWATPSENQADRIRHGTSAKGENNAWHVLTEDAVREIRVKGTTRGAKDLLALKYGIHRKYINAVVSRRAWSHII